MFSFFFCLSWATLVFLIVKVNWTEHNSFCHHLWPARSVVVVAVSARTLPQCLCFLIFLIFCCESNYNNMTWGSVQGDTFYYFYQLSAFQSLYFLRRWKKLNHHLYLKQRLFYTCICAATWGKKKNVCTSAAHWDVCLLPRWIVL